MDVEEEGQLPPPPPDSDAVGPARPPAGYDAAAAYAAYPEPTEQQWCAAWAMQMQIIAPSAPTPLLLHPAKLLSPHSNAHPGTCCTPHHTALLRMLGRPPDSVQDPFGRQTWLLAGSAFKGFM